METSGTDVYFVKAVAPMHEKGIQSLTLEQLTAEQAQQKVAMLTKVNAVYGELQELTEKLPAEERREFRMNGVTDDADVGYKSDEHKRLTYRYNAIEGPRVFRLVEGGNYKVGDILKSLPRGPLRMERRSR